MSAIPQLMQNLAPQSDIVRGLIAITMEHKEEEEEISNVIQKALHSDASSIYPSLEEFTSDNPNITTEKCQTAAKLTNELFSDSHSFDHFILTPLPDNNAPEEFASSTDLLLLRWPRETIKPWESSGEHVLDIENSNLDNNFNAGD